MTRCVCGHSTGVHWFVNQLGSCAFPGCPCKKHVLDIKPTISETIKRVAKEDLALLKRLAPNDTKGTKR